MDAGGAGLLLIFPLMIILLLLVWGFVEGFVIYLFRINSFWRSIWHAIIVNLISLVAGFIIIGVSRHTGWEEYTEIGRRSDLTPWIVYFVISVIIESLVLKAMNRSKSWGRIFSAGIVMNIVSYIILYAYNYYYG